MNDPRREKLLEGLAPLARWAGLKDSEALLELMGLQLLEGNVYLQAFLYDTRKTLAFGIMATKRGPESYLTWLSEKRLLSEALVLHVDLDVANRTLASDTATHDQKERALKQADRAKGALQALLYDYVFNGPEGRQTAEDAEKDITDFYRRTYSTGPDMADKGESGEDEARTDV